MKSLVLILVLAFTGGIAAGEPSSTSAPEQVHPVPTVVRSHEILHAGPSGFWTPNHPAIGGSYRYRLLGIGVAIAGIMGLLMIKLVRKANGAPRMAIVKVETTPRTSG